MTPPPDESAPTAGKWKRLRWKGEEILLRGFRAVVRCLPLSAARRLADVLGTIAAHVDRQGRATALENLRVAFGESPEHQRVVRDCYRNFARTFVELFWSPRLTPEILASQCRWRFDDEAATLAAASGGGVFVTPHYGNFEWLAMAWCQRTRPVVIIAQDSKNPHVTPLITADRAHSGNEIVPQQGALLRLLRAVKSGKQVALLPDLTTPPKAGGVVVEMFGLKASLTTLPAALAQRTGCPIIPAISIPQKDGTVLLHFVAPIRPQPGDDPRLIAQQCWDAFEPILRENPAPWLWMYKHWRYLPENAEKTTYPAYAKPSKAFQSIIPDSQI
ncbi:MAG: lysophospholipid acyltransferase family protein [Verrucomicrobiales bacterium]